jgi:hypothetical protein
MITIELNNTNYTLPTRFNEINLDKYIKISNISTELNDTDRLIKILSILTNIKESLLRNIELDMIVYMSNQIKFMFEHKDHVLIEQFKINDQWYGLNKDIKSITFGEYIDLEEFSKPENKQENLHILMAILYRPIENKYKVSKLDKFINKYIYKLDNKYKIKKYDPDEIKDRAELFKEHVTIDIVLGALFFFIILKEILIMNTRQYLTKKMLKKMIMNRINQMNINYQMSGVG